IQGNVNFYEHTIAPWAALNFSLLDKKLTIVGALRAAILENHGGFDFGVDGHPEIKDADGVKLTNDFQNTFLRWEPRMSIRYQIIPQLAAKAALGTYVQAPSPQTLSGPFGNVNALPETANHYVAGFDINPYNGLSISLEGFYKDLRNIIVRGEKPG